MIFVIDDLTFLLYCQYEFNMSPSEAGILFCVSAICLFIYGLTITGPLVDKLGIKISLLIGLSMYTFTKFFLIFIEYRWQLWLVMVTIAPLGISIIFPALILAVKKLTFENSRPLAFSFFFGAMVLGAVFGGPIIDWIRHDFKLTTLRYNHYNKQTDEEETRTIEFSAWRTISFVGFLLNFILTILMMFYDTKTEARFQEEDIDWDEINKLTYVGIFRDLFKDRKFWRFLLFSVVIIGPKLVFTLFFFMLPRIIMQDYGEDAPFGIYISIAPIFILLFLWILTPIQATYDAYDLILLGCIVATFAPTPMYFGMVIACFIVFIIIISLAEAIYSPMINVFTFNFTKPGREGTFLTLTAAPMYFTMAVTGIMGGYLLENFYPPEDDDNHHKQPYWIWIIIMIVSAVSCIILFIFRDYFNCIDSEYNGS